MPNPLLASSALRRVGLLTAVVAALSACNSDRTTTPSAMRGTPQSPAFFAPSANKALYGVLDGVYTMTVNPAVDNNVFLSKHYLSLPANSVCAIGTSTYGLGTWDTPCAPQTLPFVLTITVKDAQTDHPQVDFTPAMRFNPNRTVQLFMYVPGATETDARNWLMNYCPTIATTGCVNEVALDPSLTTFVDRNAQYVYRRVKHFSGYVIAGRDGDSTDTSGIQ